MSEAAPSVTFAIISNAPAASALLETVCEELKSKAGLSIQPLVLRSYDKLLEAMRGGEVHIAWAPPLIALDLELADVATVRLCSRRAGKADYSSVLFTAQTSAVNKLEDLKGGRAAWVDKDSSAGYLVPRLKLLAEGLDPDKIFAAQTMRRTHEAVVRVVMNGEAELGATFGSFEAGSDVPVSAGWLDAGYENEEVRILGVAGPIPSDVIAVSTQLDRGQADAITAAMKDLGESIKRLLNADAFDVPEKTHFDELRRLVESAKQTQEKQ